MKAKRLEFVANISTNKHQEEVAALTLQERCQRYNELDPTLKLSFQELSKLYNNLKIKNKKIKRVYDRKDDYYEHFEDQLQRNKEQVQKTLS